MSTGVFLLHLNEHLVPLVELSPPPGDPQFVAQTRLSINIKLHVPLSLLNIATRRPHLLHVLIPIRVSESSADCFSSLSVKVLDCAVKLQ